MTGTSPATLTSHLGEEGLEVTLAGRLDGGTVGPLWTEMERALDGAAGRPAVVKGAGIEYCDGAGVALLIDLRRRQRAAGGDVEFEGLGTETANLLALYDPAAFEADPVVRPRSRPFLATLGAAARQQWNDARRILVFAGALTRVLGAALLRPRLVRWKDVLTTAETAGVNALPIVSVISVLMGLILAYQAAIPMQLFGAELYVADLVSISIVRELGPLMTAIVLCGRSGSAFAAELGTMKVNEEIDALTTMGLDPVRFLAMPRVIAAVATTPLLAAYANLCGLIGGAVVFRTLGFPLVTYVNQVNAIVDYGDLLGGLFKAFVFGIVVAAVGCVRGLQTKSGASAVGESTTRAVVTGILLVVVGDGIFAVVFYQLGI